MMADTPTTPGPADLTPYRTHADRYLAAGWPGVLPLPHQAKHSPPKGYTGGDGADPTVTDIATWKRSRSAGNIALRMSPTIVGIDVDAYGNKPGGDTLAELENQLGPLPRTWTSTSRTDGTSGIRFYRLNGPTKLIGALPGIEIIQRHHRYAVVAPSIHPEGREYRWISPDGEIGDQIPHVDHLPTLPQAWQDHLAADNHTPTQRRAIATGGDVAPAVDRALGTALRGLVQGTRHDSALAGANALTRLAQQGYPGAGNALDHLGRAFAASIADRAGPKEADAEWQRMIDGAEAFIASTPAQIPRHEDRQATGRLNPADLILATPKQRALAASVPAPAGDEDNWPELPDPPQQTPSVDVPIDALPAWMADQVRNVTRQLECDPIIPFAFALGALSVASLGHVQLAVRAGQVERSTGLYLAVAGPPASGKSPAMTMMFGPVREVEAKRIEQAATAIAEADAEVKLLTKRAEEKFHAAAKLDDDHAAAEAKKLTAQAATVERPAAGEMMTSDITPERLATLMAANNERMAIVSDESGVLTVDRYGDRGAAKKLDLYLQGFTGEPVAVHRVKADTVRLTKPLLAIVAGVQPQALAAVMADPEWRTRGMGARFLVTSTSQVATNVDIDRDVWDHEVGETYSERLGHLARQWSSWGSPATLKMSAASRGEFSRWSAGLLDREGAGGELEGESGWSSKMRTSTLRIAALLHLADGQATTQEIELGVMKRAIIIAESFISEFSAEAPTGGDSEVRLLSWLLTQSSDGEVVARGHRATSRFVARRDLCRRGPRGLRTREEHHEALLGLAEAGLVRFPGVENMLVTEQVRRAKTIELHPDGEAWVARATARDSARQGRARDNETSREAESVARVARVAYRGLSDPPPPAVLTPEHPSGPPPRATRATSATLSAFHDISSPIGLDADETDLLGLPPAPDATNTDPQDTPPTRSTP